MAQPSISLPKPNPNQPYMEISALQAGTIHLPNDLIIQGNARTYTACPSLSFYLKHSQSDRHFIFDLGLRRDFDSYPPETKQYHETLMPSEVTQSVVESCEKGGINPAEVERVVISHLHFDHIGDHSPFAKATFILGGESRASLKEGYPNDPLSTTLADSTPMDRTVFLDADDFDTSVGPFPHAKDLFEDGSVYIIDTPGHCAGHITVLARTSTDGAWMFLAGDVVHDTRLLTDHSTRIGTAAASGEPYCMHRDPVQAMVDISRARELIKMQRVEFIISHDWKWVENNLSHAFLPGKIASKVRDVSTPGLI
ncbi:Lactamase-B domain-containing protein [Favolaschia claudopus]|uniref:Lactamase-B domain-containing protein n=1 Tax=Favolaschia claudopus TaxID=2862362 RepID=A0AAW0CK09_9AGAR